MGLFSRKEADSSKGRASSPKRRTASPSEAYADDLRGRARRRLIGALALVVIAVIVVPELITSDSGQPAETPIVVPAIPPIPEPSVAVTEPLSTGQSAPDGELSVDTPALPVAEPVTSGDDAGQASSDTSQPQAPEPQAKPEPAPKPESKPAPETKSTKADRTDDGSVAIALLEGRQPNSPPAAPTRGNFVVQIAAYSSRQDADARRASLVSAGVTNAYVESASLDGKTTYRLRVGPFSTREAAQAAQTRLRSLDYPTSFIASQ